MSKRYNAKELNYILSTVIANAYEYMEAIIADLKKVDISKGLDSISEVDKSKLRSLNMQLTVINDIVHPAHKLSYKDFTKYGPMIDWYEKSQQIAFDKNIVPTCYALCCDPDGAKTKLKAAEVSRKLEEYDKLKEVGAVSNEVH